MDSDGSLRGERAHHLGLGIGHGLVGSPQYDDHAQGLVAGDEGRHERNRLILAQSREVRLQDVGVG